MGNDIGNPLDSEDSMPTNPVTGVELRDFEVAKNTINRDLPAVTSRLDRDKFKPSKEFFQKPEARLMKIVELLKDKKGNLIGLKGDELKYNSVENAWEIAPKGGIWGYQENASSYPAALPLGATQLFRVGDHCIIVPATRDTRIWSAISADSETNILMKIIEPLAGNGCCTGYYTARRVQWDSDNCQYVTDLTYPDFVIRHKDGQTNIPINIIVMATYYPDINFLKSPRDYKLISTDMSEWVFDEKVSREFIITKEVDYNFNVTPMQTGVYQATLENILCDGTDAVADAFTIYELNYIYGIPLNTKVTCHLNKDGKWVFDTGGSFTTKALITSCGVKKDGFYLYEADQLLGTFKWRLNVLPLVSLNEIVGLKGQPIIVVINSRDTNNELVKAKAGVSAPEAYFEKAYLQVNQICYGDPDGSSVKETIEDVGVILAKPYNEECSKDPSKAFVRAITTESTVEGLDLKIKTKGECIKILLEGEISGGGGGGGSDSPITCDDVSLKRDGGDIVLSVGGEECDRVKDVVPTCKMFEVKRQDDNLIFKVNGETCAEVNLCCDEDNDSGDDDDDTDDDGCCYPQIIFTPQEPYPCEANYVVGTVALEGCEDFTSQWSVDAPFAKLGDLVILQGKFTDGEVIQGLINASTLGCDATYVNFEIVYKSCDASEEVFEYEYCGGGPPVTTAPVTTTPFTPYVPACCSQPGKVTTPQVTVLSNNGHPRQEEEVDLVRCCADIVMEYDSKIIFNPVDRSHKRTYTGQAAGQVCTDFIEPGEIGGKRQVTGVIKATKGRDIRATATIRDDESGFVSVNIPGYRLVNISVPEPAPETVTETFNNSFAKGEVSGITEKQTLGGPAEDPAVGSIKVTDDCDQTWVATVIGGDGENNGDTASYKLKLVPNGRNTWNIVLRDYWDTTNLIVVTDEILNILISFVGECGDSGTYNFVSNRRPAPPKPDIGGNGGNGGGNGGGPGGTGGNGGGPDGPFTPTPTTTPDGGVNENVDAYFKIKGVNLEEFVTYLSVDCNSEAVIWSLYNDRDEPADYLYFELIPMPYNKARLVANQPPPGDYRIRALAANTQGIGDPVLLEINVKRSNVAPQPKLLIGSYLT